MLPLLVLLGTIAGAWYLLIVRPQKEQQTRHGQLVERLQVGDHVLTVGGIYGRVVAVEGPSVVLELAPGLTSRIATDGIARIVHGGDGTLLPTPTQASRPQEPPKALDTDMHQHPHQDQQHAPQHAAPQYTAPTQPWTAQQPQPPAQLPAPAPQHVAQPVAPNVHGHEARPWGDLAPVNHQPAAPAPQYAVAPQYATAPAPQQQYAPAPPQYAQAPQQYAPAPQQHVVGGSIPSAPPLPMPLVRPFAERQHAMPAVQPSLQPAYQPHLQPAPQPAAQPQLVPAHLAPAHAPQPQHVHQSHVGHAPQAPAQAQETSDGARRHSRAPQGMGSSLRLDDPSLRDTMTRARDERAELAGEYRKLTAPLVDVGAEQPHVAPPAEVQAPPGTAFVGHDPNGVPLFAAPGSPVAHPVAQYPGPARPEAAGSMPRPVVQSAGSGSIDPALTSAAFQRRTPYAPDPALQREPAPQPQPAMA